MSTNHKIQKPLLAKNLYKSYGEYIVLKNTSIAINPGESIGLIGQNGCGKSTLLKILCGHEKPDQGFVINNGIKIGYLAQDYSLDLNKTIREIATAGIMEIIQALDTFDKMNRNFQAENPVFLKEYEEISKILESNQAYELENRIETILKNIGLSYSQNTFVKELSGGETVKLALAQLLISQPDILLLDEPTNHLDLKANFWLRGFIRQFEGGVLLVSHNRDFLDNVIDSIWELESGQIRVFGGNYRFYKEQKKIEQEARAKEIIRLESIAKKARRKIQQEQQRAAHSSRKDLNKNPDDQDKSRAHYFREKASKTEGLKSKQVRDKKRKADINLKEIRGSKKPTISANILETGSHKGKKLIEIVNTKFGYPEKTIVRNVNLQINYGDRVSLFGKNGAGKTTLIRGILSTDGVIVDGCLTEADNINIQYLDQRYSLVDRQKSILENLVNATPEFSIPERRQHLAKFLFMESTEVNKKLLSSAAGK
ncbi:MAG: ABC-F family ATP-binding cassette domain-containing protein [Anaerolineaceae bacterium]|nr:ABC-F family ATP-binding cassette domain-containing protein [Anaerolineaceae bacterium]